MFVHFCGLETAKRRTERWRRKNLETSKNNVALSGGRAQTEPEWKKVEDRDPEEGCVLSDECLETAERRSCRCRGRNEKPVGIVWLYLGEAFEQAYEGKKEED